LHNPRCSKSRATLALLEERGVSFETRLYLEDPLDTQELGELGQRLGRPILEWTRKKEGAFGAAGLSKDSGDAEVREAMQAAPILMERPIVIRGDRAAIGRPPEDVLTLLD
jgi:arsenate reductase